MNFVPMASYQLAALSSPYEHTAMYGGVGCGKSFTLAHYDINEMRKNPHLDGFIGANTYDQLNQATLKELFYWLDNYQIPYVINCRPPKEWHTKTRFASYNNILSTKIGPQVVNAYIRVLSDPNALRGIQFGWYSLDEIRDTKQESHDVLLSRMRQSKYRKGLVGSTTNGEGWDFHRFVKARPGQRLYGSMHIRTIEAVKLGILTQGFYDSLRASYSELMSMQELDALHVNVHGGRAYYSGSERNRRRSAPWGDEFPDPARELIVGCDFNFDPAPHIWMVGQMGAHPITQEPIIHWFEEIAMNRASTPSMALALLNRFPGFYYRVFGDRSGARATTSNAGKPDYDQIGEILADNDCSYNIDSDQTNNPLVRNRVENMNRLFLDSRGVVRQTYNPDKCPHFDSDVKMVGWKQTIRTGQGKLDDGGDKKLTHATDGAGYAVWKLIPYTKRGRIISGIRNITSSSED